MKITFYNMQALINQKPQWLKSDSLNIYMDDLIKLSNLHYTQNIFVNLHSKLPNISMYMETHTPFQQLNLRNPILDCPHNNNCSRYCYHGCHHMCQNWHQYNCGNCRCHNLNKMKHWAPKNTFLTICFVCQEVTNLCVLL